MWGFMSHYLPLKLSDFKGVIVVYIFSLLLFSIYKQWILHNAKFTVDLFGFGSFVGLLFVLDCYVYNTIKINVIINLLVFM